MLLTPHLLAGAAIASKVSNPFLALPLAFLSHYLLDMPPQTEYKIENIKKGRWSKASSDFFKVFLDISLGVLLISLFSAKDPIIFMGAFIAIVPDGITLASKIFPQNKLFIRHQKLHEALNKICNADIKKRSFLWGIITQLIVISAAIFLLLQ